MAKRSLTMMTMLVALALLTGCRDYPRDPEETLDRIRAEKIVRIGVIENPPWTERLPGGKGGGTEGMLAARFAAAIGARPRWIFLPEAHAAKQLRRYDLDIAIGGLTTDNPRKTDMSFTRPYRIVTAEDGTKIEHVMAVAPGENALLAALETFLAQTGEAP
jgi:hypothetical protein